MSSTKGLPIADNRQVIRFIGGLLGERRLLVVAVVVANALAAVAGLLVPRLLGNLVDSTVADVQAGRVDAALAGANSAAVVVAGLVVLQGLFAFAAKLSSTVLGQDVLAAAREYVVRAILRLPLSRVESASSGDLVTRVTRDVGTMSESVRWALPESIVAGITVVLTLVAMVSNSWVLSVPSVVLMALAMIQVRRYLLRAPKGYLTEGGTYSRINTTLTETVEGARTVEALRLSRHRLTRGDGDIDVSGQAERYTMTLRNLLFVVMDVAFSLPRVLVLAARGGRLRAGLGLPRPDHDGDPLHRGALGALRHARPHRRPGAGRGRLDDPTARHRDRATRPRGRPRPTDRSGPRRHRPALRLPGGPRRAPRRRPHAAHGGAARRRRPEWLRQVDARPPPVGHPRAAHRLGGGRRGRAHRPAARPAPHRGRARHAGAPRLHRQRARQRRARPGGRERRRGDLRARGRRRLAVGRAAARRPRHPDRLRPAGAHARAAPSRSRWPGSSSPTRTRSSSTRRPPSSTRARPATSRGR